jgi:hypothetical protein
MDVRWIMAKKRDITISNMRVTDSGCELVAKIGLSLKLYEGDVATDHVMNINMSMTLTQLIMLALKSIVIDAQKIMRSLGTHAKVYTWTETPKTYADIYAAERKVSVKADMTPEQIRVKAFADPKFRAELMAELMEMQDTLDSVQADVVNGA